MLGSVAAHFGQYTNPSIRAVKSDFQNVLVVMTRYIGIENIPAPFLWFFTSDGRELVTAGVPRRR